MLLGFGWTGVLWSLIAGRLPGRTANDVKNYWHGHLLKNIVSKKEEGKNEKQKETMKAHEVIKPQPRTFSTNSPWLKGKQILASNKDDIIPTYHDDQLETMVPNHIGIDYASSSKPSPGNTTPIPCAMLMDSLWNLEEPVGSSEIIGSSSSFQEENYNMEFPNVDDSFWDSDLCDFNSLWNL
ncbi:hypothetical protein TSUD_213210 [Trifolium subterraneum]|uniref:Uncharacterized protein n=1 Tax=Trifolium subterraneum TaxID=3900 RepID=A0A2Z6N511_TRISU|nr:hypothetical protein TSUD_213210 [Trifolium subterraneum]